jgi:hypothetical protein
MEIELDVWKGNANRKYEERRRGEEKKRGGEEEGHQPLRQCNSRAGVFHGLPCP